MLHVWGSFFRSRVSCVDARTRRELLEMEGQLNKSNFQTIISIQMGSSIDSFSSSSLFHSSFVKKEFFRKRLSRENDPTTGWMYESCGEIKQYFDNKHCLMRKKKFFRKFLKISSRNLFLWYHINPQYFIGQHQNFVTNSGVWVFTTPTQIQRHILCEIHLDYTFESLFDADQDSEKSFF